MIDFIDNEEKEIIESLNSEPWFSDFDENIKKKYEEYAKNSLLNKRQITANISERDYNKLHFKAIQNGVPYEFLIATLIHNFNEGKIELTI